MNRYVVGFLFNEDFTLVTLIRKNKPDWQRGKLNGVGGKIEVGEIPLEAMVREFVEEAGLTRDWHQFATLSGLNNDGERFELECFYATALNLNLFSQEEEKIEVWPVEKMHALRTDMIGNLAWLIALARDQGTGAYPPAFAKVTYGH